MTEDVGNVFALGLLKSITVALGLVIVTLAWRAYRGSRRRTFLWLTIGFGLMTLGAIAEGAAFQSGAVLPAWDVTLGEAHLVEAAFTLAAFAALTYSLYAKDEAGAEDAAPADPADVPHAAPADEE